MTNLGPESSAFSTPTEVADPNEAIIDHLVQIGVFNYDDASRRVLGTPFPSGSHDVGEQKPKITKTHRRGSVRDYDGRADEYRGGMGAPAVGYEDTYVTGLAKVREALAQARLSHRSSDKTTAVEQALREIGLAKSARGAYDVFAADELDDSRRAHLGRYRDGDHALTIAEQHEAIAAEAMMRACGKCALACFMNERPSSFIREFESPEARKALRKSIKATGAAEVDFNCSDSVIKEKH